MPTGLLGGVGLTHLTVYDQRSGPDGLLSGCPHVHAVTDEAYLVISGTGALELHDEQLGFRSIPLAAESYVQFPPGTLHRAVNYGGLTAFCIMTNGGLAERGDARIWFGPEVDADPKLYQALWRLPVEHGLEGALERRDRSVLAYGELLRLWEEDKPAYFAELARFKTVHARAVEPLRGQFKSIVSEGASAWLAATRSQIDSLPDAYPKSGAVSVTPESGEPKLGMCGLLRQFEMPVDV